MLEYYSDFCITHTCILLYKSRPAFLLKLYVWIMYNVRLTHITCTWFDHIIRPGRMRAFWTALLDAIRRVQPCCVLLQLFFFLSHYGLVFSLFVKCVACKCGCVLDAKNCAAACCCWRRNILNAFMLMMINIKYWINIM